MPIRYVDGDEPCAFLDGRVIAEDAEAFLEWLRRTYDPAVDLRSCTDPHTALMQLLLGARVRIVQLPSDPMLAGCLADNDSKVPR
jgi:hypothetical protein